MRSTIALAVIGLALLAGPAHARTGYPPHHALWTCIQPYEASWHNHGPGHYGGLQMTWNWLGTKTNPTKYVNGDAGNMTQAAQEWAAENAWRDYGYTYGFLYGQWYRWNNADGCGTTG